ncbi:sarcosine oxidase subunit gamma [Fuscibacter oryzae]|uniref:Sarcosine oxidase subunit gamma n=1 Tax=Fuscibacter oryzae TaxID=2803939 RepID=A0A8J7ST23_9RHOB|nr:sarcosine oxidase subunit gamma family protein [Fuscibacter oryzae]MBL4927167.1 sarcosine oxidase subunit gamma [Fuscibacter oryzae]
MPELIAKTALLGKKPVTFAGTTLAEGDAGPVASIALFPGQDKAAAKALKPLAFPAPNSFTESEAARLVWTGRDQAFLIGAEPPALGGIAAVTDQSGGWATLTLTGPMAVEALMRLVPLDLRATFAVGQAARAPLGHMQSILFRTAPDSFTLMVFRSMARTAWHEIEVALRSLAARAALA